MHPTPVGIADIVTTTIHKTLGGPRGGMVMCTSELASKIDKAVFPGLQGGPLMHVIAGKAVALGHALTPEFRARQQAVVDNCRTLAEGLLAGGVNLVSGGTDNHLVLVDLSDTELTGKDAEIRLDHAGITVNKNGVPFDERPPTVTSGLRIGTAALTTRGLREPEMTEIASIISAALQPCGRRRPTSRCCAAAPAPSATASRCIPACTRARPSEPSLAYRELPAPPPLVRGWRAPGSSRRATEGVHRVLPDGCIDLVWREREGLQVAGPSTAAFMAALPPGAVACGVRLRTGRPRRCWASPRRPCATRTSRPRLVWGDAARRLEERLAARPPAPRERCRPDGARGPAAVARCAPRGIRSPSPSPTRSGATPGSRVTTPRAPGRGRRPPAAAARDGRRRLRAEAPRPRPPAPAGPAPPDGRPVPRLGRRRPPRRLRRPGPPLGGVPLLSRAWGPPPSAP